MAVGHKNGDIYACDYCNNRIQVYLHDSNVCNFGDEITAMPIDIQLTSYNIKSCLISMIILLLLCRLYYSIVAQF